MAALRKKSKTISAEWLKFAEQVVEQAGIIDERTHALLVEGFSSVARDKFVVESAKRFAFEDAALPALHGQICDKPSWLARVLGLLGIAPGMRVLEIGCGCGYATAVMAQCGAYVFSLEDVALVAQRTRRLLDALYLHNVILKHADTRAGWADQGPFDAIVCWGVLDKVEQNLLQQLVTPSGRLVARVGGGEHDDNSDNSSSESPTVLTLWETRATGSIFYQLEQC